MLNKYMTQIMSYYDIGSDEPEKSYHLFSLGVLVTMADRYQVVSNRESGYGCFDIMLIPVDKKQQGVVIEFKKKDADETLVDACQRALEQIKERDYAAMLRAAGVQGVTFFGIGCEGKKVMVVKG